MKVLIVHNAYSRQLPSGENEAVATDADLLRDAGHDVETVVIESDVALRGTTAKRMKGSLGGLALGGSRAMRQRLDPKPEVVHLHNPFPFWSAGALREVRAAGVPLVTTVHNYRLSCMAGTHFRAGRVCHECETSGSSLPGVRHGCYRDSHVQSAAILLRRRSTISSVLDCAHYFALTEHHRNYLVDGQGIAPDKVTVRGNPLPDPHASTFRPADRDAFLFVGRLSPEKGVDLMLEAWRRMGPEGPRLQVAGEGPLAVEVDLARREGLPITGLGRLGQDEVLEAMRGVRALVVPSTCYEGLPRVVVEAFAVGLPVIATGLGGLRTVVDDTVGRMVDATAVSLATAVRELARMDDDTLAALGRQARGRYERRYSAEAALALLLEGYAAARAA